MAENVRFKTASQAKYDALENKNAATLYWCLDTQRLYKGDKLFSVGLEATQQFAGLLSAEDKKKLDALVAGSIAGLEAVDGTMSITDGNAGVKKLGVNVSKEAGNLIAVKADGLFVHVDVPEYTFIQEETPIGDNFATYTLRKTLDGLSEDCGHINIPKDKFLQNATVEVVTVADQPYAGAVVGEKYLDLVFNDAESSHVYVPLKDLAGKTYIGENGNWYVGQTDTGVSATGPAGQDGAPGAPGPAGPQGPKGEMGPQGLAGPALAVTNTSTVGQTIMVSAVDETGQPTEWEAVDMPEQVQPDWNQNDSTAADYVKNRPFYTRDTVEETVLVEESTIPFVENSGVYLANLPQTFEATAGETYKVSWDGTVYECTSARTEEGVFTIGNPSIIGAGSDTGEPFIIGVLNGSVILIYTQDTSDSHTVSISRISYSVVKLDEKFLPENVATKSAVEVAQTTANSAKTTAENAKNTANSANNTANSAKTTAENAQNTANSAKTAANEAKTTAENAQNTANSAKTAANEAKTTANEAKDKVAQALTIDSTGSIKAPTVGMGSGTYQELRLTSKDGYHNSIFKLTKSTGLQIWVPRDGGLAGTQTNNPATIEFIANGSKRICLKGINELIMKSSTPDSTKKFRITVDDSGTLSTTEVT